MQEILLHEKVMQNVYHRKHNMLTELGKRVKMNIKKHIKFFI